MDARSLIETLKGRGLSLYLEGERIKVEAPQEPDPETKALVDELKRHREEVKIILAAPPCWNCGAMMTRTKDIYGEEVSICVPCAVSGPFRPLFRADSGHRSGAFRPPLFLGLKSKLLSDAG